MKSTEPVPPSPPALGTLLLRALKLRCPRCGRGRLFTGRMTMPERCPVCRLKYERAPGYYLGSIYINYAMTAALLTAAYVVLHFGLEISNKQLALPLAAFCVIFPMASFRHARAFWLALDCCVDTSILAGEE